MIPIAVKEKSSGILPFVNSSKNCINEIILKHVKIQSLCYNYYFIMFPLTDFLKYFLYIYRVKKRMYIFFFQNKNKPYI